MTDVALNGKDRIYIAIDLKSFYSSVECVARGLDPLTTNLVVAKHIPADKDGVRIAELDEMSYRCKLWDHQPMTDFWRFGRGIVARLNGIGIETMGQLARMSVNNEELLYRMFGVNAELIIDHSWGWEPVTMDYI